MGNTIYKLPDDQYCLWSDNVDAPLTWGTKDDVRDWLLRFDRRCARCDRQEVAERFERTDAHTARHRLSIGFPTR